MFQPGVHADAYLRVDILLRLALLDLVKRRARDEHESVLDQCSLQVAATATIVVGK